MSDVKKKSLRRQLKDFVGPFTHDEALKRKEKFAKLYLLCTFVLLNIFAFRYVIDKREKISPADYIKQSGHEKGRVFTIRQFKVVTEDEINLKAERIEAMRKELSK